MRTPGLSLLVLATAALLSATGASAEPRHGLSAFDALKYPADFTHFDYVNPDAPKGGEISTIGTAAVTTFDSLNYWILKGDPAQGLPLLFDTLMVRAQDEPDAVYGLLAESADVSADGRAVTFRLRPEARFHDGTPVRAQDAVFSFETLKEKGHPDFRLSLRDVVSAEAIDDHTVVYRFEGDNLRDLPITVATLPVLSEAYYATRPFEETTLEPPVGSGPYRVGDFKAGSFIAYERDPDYWGRDLPVNVGRHNFDRIRYLYFRDRVAGMEAFKAGTYTLREEFTSKTWATEYDFPAAEAGLVAREVLPDARPSGTQGWFLNTRRPHLADWRVRKALDFAFDFEWTNATLFYGAYSRTDSFFENSDMQAEGAASAEERALLEPFLGQLPPDILDAPYLPPTSDGSGRDRDNLREADRLLREAGFAVKDGRRTMPDGRPFRLEFLMFEPSFERVNAPFLQNLERLGIEASMRIVDPAQYQRRLKSFDYDIVTSRFVLRPTPGAEMRNFWTSGAAATEGSRNYAGISSPVVDALTERMIAAGSRADLVTAARALDRVLRAGHYWVAHWYSASHRIAYWDMFGRPEAKPAYGRGILDLWWVDPAKKAALDAARGR